MEEVHFRLTCSEASLLKFPNHVYGKPQTRVLSSQFHKLGDERVKTVQNNFRWMIPDQPGSQGRHGGRVGEDPGNQVGFLT